MQLPDNQNKAELLQLTLETLIELTKQIETLNKLLQDIEDGSVIIKH